MLIADQGAKAEFRNDEHVDCDIGTARMVADIFRQLFFQAVRTDKARLDGYLRNRSLPLPDKCNAGDLVCRIGKRTF